MKIKNFIFRMLVVLSLFSFFACKGHIVVTKDVMDSQVITAEQLLLDSVISVSAENEMIVEPSLSDKKIKLDFVGYGQTSVVVKGKMGEVDVDVVLTVNVSKKIFGRKLDNQKI